MDPNNQQEYSQQNVQLPNQPSYNQQYHYHQQQPQHNQQYSFTQSYTQSSSSSQPEKRLSKYQKLEKIGEGALQQWI